MKFGVVYDKTKKEFYDFVRRSSRKGVVRGQGVGGLG